MIRRPPRSTLFPTRRSSDLDRPAHPGPADRGVADARPPAAPVGDRADRRRGRGRNTDRKSTRLNSSHTVISYAVFCLKKKKKKRQRTSVSDAVKRNAIVSHL